MTNKNRPNLNQEDQMSTQYEMTSGYVGSMGSSWKIVEGVDLETALNDAATHNKTPRAELETLLNDGRGRAAETGKHSPNYFYDHGMAMIRVIGGKKPAQIAMKKCSCGHTIPTSQVMSASMGSSCPDCYDRMSE